MWQKKLTVAPSDTSTKQNIENLQNGNTVSDKVNNQCKKSIAIYHLKSNETKFITWNATTGAKRNQLGQVRPPTERNSPAISYGVQCY